MEGTKVTSRIQERIYSAVHRPESEAYWGRKEGYTDLSFKSDCVLYTSQMVIYSPYKPTIEETIKPLLSTPDLSMEIESLLSDIHEVHRINLTTLGQEFQTLNIDIQNELVEITKVNDVLQRAANIKSEEKYSQKWRHGRLMSFRML